MTTWWESLTLLEQIFALIAIPSTLILLIQTILLLFGIGDGEADTNFDGDVGADAPDDVSGDDGVSLFSIRGIVAFLSVAGWSGVVFLGTQMHYVLAIFLSVLLGFAALLGIFFMMRAVMRLQQSGNVNLGNAIGKTGRVYIPIPSDASGSGKVNITIQEKYLEADAITTATRRLETGELVRVVATDETGLLVVEPVLNK